MGKVWYLKSDLPHGNGRNGLSPAIIRSGRSRPPVNPNPKAPHEVAPAEEEDVVEPLRDGGGVGCSIGGVLELGVVGVEIGSGAKIELVGKAEAEGHNVQGRRHCDDGHCNCQRPEKFFLCGGHYLKRSSCGTSKTTPERRNQTANSVRRILKVWPTM